MEPLFFPIFGGVFLLFAVASYVFPQKKTFQMHEYLQFFLSSIGSFWVLFMLGRLTANSRWEDMFYSNGALLVLLFIWITLTHLIFPFKKVKRNKYFTVITVSLLVIFVVLTAIAWIGMQTNH